MNDSFSFLKCLLIKDRSIRRFKEDYEIERQQLIDLVGLTRFCASGRNLQPLKYYLVNDKELCQKVFPLLKWAGYLSDWEGPIKGERPSAYLIQCLDRSLTNNCLCDDGLQLQAITLGATSLGLGCCIIKSFNLGEVKRVLRLSDNLDPLYVIAIGKPNELVKIEDLKDEDLESIKYYRTPDGLHHVPKRALKDLLIN